MDNQLTQLDKVIIAAGFSLLVFTGFAYYHPGTFADAWTILASITTTIWGILIGKKMDKNA